MQSVEQHFVRSHIAGTKDVECCWVRVPRLLDKNEFEICQLPILQDVATCLHPSWNPTQFAMHKPTKSNKYACPSFCSIASSQVGARTLRAYSKQPHTTTNFCVILTLLSLTARNTGLTPGHCHFFCLHLPWTKTMPLAGATVADGPGGVRPRGRDHRWNEHPKHPEHATPDYDNESWMILNEYNLNQFDFSRNASASYWYFIQTSWNASHRSCTYDHFNPTTRRCFISCSHHAYDEGCRCCPARWCSWCRVWQVHVLAWRWQV